MELFNIRLNSGKNEIEEIILEEWRDIKDYEGIYQVSNLGRVRSIDRYLLQSNGAIRHYEGRVLKGGHDATGRKQYSLYVNQKYVNKRPWILVAEAFIGERPEGYHVCHIDGDHTNNKLTNLRYDTARENAIDFYRYGSKNPNGKLTIEQVLEIRKLYDTGNYSYNKLGEKFNIGKSMVGYIVKREFYTWLNDDGTIEESKTGIQ